LIRGLGTVEATALNIANMVGIGPFITIPAFLSAMGGPHALVAWLIAAVLVICDGLVWSELGAALPGSGGSYHFLRQIYGRYRWGRLLPFLFIWQFMISGTLEMASGYIGAADYAAYLFPALNTPLWLDATVTYKNLAAAGAAVAITLLLFRTITSLGSLGVFLTAGTLITVAIVIVAGLLNFDSRLITLPDTPPKGSSWSIGLGGAMLIAIYDYLGYYNVCHLGDEVRDPGKTIPRAVMISVVAIAAIYLTMNISIIGVVPWQEAMTSTNIAATFIERLYGNGWAQAFTLLILWTSVACMFAITLGYSRIPFAAARNGDFFAIFGRVHPTERYPIVSLAALGILTALFCFCSLQAVINAAVVVRILTQFIAQIVGLHLVRTTRPDIAMPFRMWLYPLPSIVAIVGWLFVLGADPTNLAIGVGVAAAGTIVFFVWELLRKRVSE
jgi:amino acid transporter